MPGSKNTADPAKPPSPAEPPPSCRTVRDLYPDLARHPDLAHLADVEVPDARKRPVAKADLAHRDLDANEFWRRVPAYRDVGAEEFRDHHFQTNRSVTSVEQLATVLGDLVPPEFLDDVRAGMRRAPMNVRLSPYVVGLIDWTHPYTDPLRIQFLPLGSRLRADHPRLTLDSLHEREDSPTLGLVHRYPDKALFLAIGVCPVYCRFCTRSYAIGGDTETVAKVQYSPDNARWNRAFAYLLSRPEVEDVVVSGGDSYFLSPNNLRRIGETLLAIPHLRRIRFASKGPAVMPMKILTHDAWVDALVAVSDRGRALGKEVALHTHFNHPREITAITGEAMNRLFQRGVKVRNQSVLIRGVNDNARTLTTLVRRLSYVNVQPYYVYQHDMVSGVEDLRTRVKTAVDLERQVRGATAGFNTPIFVNDVPGGGGKRDVHSYEHYDEVTGISVYRSPAVKDDAYYLYFDPLHLLPREGRKRWARASEHETMVAEALAAAGAPVPATCAC
jgi:lysine 2,3-aminomutase